MANYDSSGRLKVAISGGNSGTGGSGVTVTNNGDTFTGITTLNFTGSHTVTSPAAGQVSVTNGLPIMYLTGWASSGTPANRNYYSADVFTGSTYFMIAALYRRTYHDAPALICGTQTAYGVGATGFGIWSPGYEYSETNVGAFSQNYFVSSQLGFPTDNKWIFHVMYWDGGSPEVGQFINGSGPRVGSSLGEAGAFNTDTFCVGAANDGSVSGNESIEIAAIAIKTASIAAYYANPVQHRLFEQVYADCDIRQFAEIGFDHIWSVKQNTPGATWAPAVGSVSLTRSGSLVVVTEAVPRWA